MRSAPRRRESADALLVTFAAATVGLDVVVKAILGGVDAVSPATLVNLAYPVLDALALGLVGGVLGSRAGRSSRPLLVLGAGVVAFCLGDAVYADRVATDTYVEGTLLDATWMTGLVLFGLAPWAPAGPETRGPVLAALRRARRAASLAAGRLRLPALAAGLASGRRAESADRINVSLSALLSPEVGAVLPGRLEGVVLEITENELVTTSFELKAKLTELRARGARVAVDDAGAGYAGLKQLMVLRPDIIKLDRLLIEGIGDDPAKLALVEAFARFGRRVGAEVCAEGIERLDDLRALADADVRDGLGFGIARPAAEWPAPDPAAVARVQDTFARMLPVAPASAGAVASEDEVGARIAHGLARLTSLSALDPVLELVAESLHAHFAHCLLHDPDRGVLVPVGRVARSPTMPTTWATNPLLVGVLRDLAAAQVRADDPEGDPAALRFLREQTGTRAMLVLPLVAGERAIGLVQVHSTAARWWSRAETARARGFAYALGAALGPLTSSRAAPSLPLS